MLAEPSHTRTLLLVLLLGSLCLCKMHYMQRRQQTPAAQSRPRSLSPVGPLWADDAPPKGSLLWAAACSCLEFKAAELLELLRGQLPVTEVIIALQQQPTKLAAAAVIIVFASLKDSTEVPEIFGQFCAPSWGLLCSCWPA